MNEIYAHTAVHVSPRELLTQHIDAYRTDPALLEKVAGEFEGVWARIGAEYAAGDVEYPLEWQVGSSSGLIEYAIVRALRCSVVVETGVANGQSSFILLQALAANDHGRLVSIDVRPDVGDLLRDEDKSRWELRLLDERDRRDSFRRIISALPPIDLFIHDSDHSYYWNKFECDEAARNLAPGAIVANDDATLHQAFLDFCREHDRSPIVLLEAKKTFGVALARR